MTNVKETEKMIGGIPKSKWVEAFADAVEIAIDKDYFSDILYYYLYEGKLPKEEDFEDEDDYEKAINALWANVDEAFVEVFGPKRIY